MDLGLRGRKALITGASRGIGLGAALSLAAEGCDVHLVARHGAGLDTARAGITRLYPVQVHCHQADVSQPGTAARLAEACPEADILVNNAGAPPPGPLSLVSDAALRQAWDLKLFGFIGLTRDFHALMTSRGRGVIINVIGNNGDRPRADRLASSMANAALMAMTRALGAESPASGVRVAGVNPGGTETERVIANLRAQAGRELGDENRWRELTLKAPFGRLATVREIADVIAFIASDRGAYISGTVVTVDGGASAR